jgi:hypothetical protein
VEALKRLLAKLGQSGLGEKVKNGTADTLRAIGNNPIKSSLAAGGLYTVARKRAEKQKKSREWMD